MKHVHPGLIELLNKAVELKELTDTLSEDKANFQDETIENVIDLDEKLCVFIGGGVTKVIAEDMWNKSVAYANRPSKSKPAKTETHG